MLQNNCTIILKTLTNLKEIIEFTIIHRLYHKPIYTSIFTKTSEISELTRLISQENGIFSTDTLLNKNYHWPYNHNDSCINQQNDKTKWLLFTHEEIDGDLLHLGSMPFNIYEQCNKLLIDTLYTNQLTNTYDLPRTIYSDDTINSKCLLMRRSDWEKEWKGWRHSNS